MTVTIVEKDPCLECTSNPEHITEDIIQSPCKAGLFPSFGFSPTVLKCRTSLRPSGGLFLSVTGNCTQGPGCALQERWAELSTLKTYIPVRCCLDTTLPCSFELGSKDACLSGWVHFIEIGRLQCALIPENLNIRVWTILRLG